MAMIGMIIMAVLLLYSFRYTKRLLYSEAILDEGDSIGWNVLALLIALAIALVIGKLGEKLSAKALLIIAIMASVFVMIAGCILAYAADIYAVGDQYQLYLAAQSFATGDLEWLADYSYFHKFPFQLAMAILYALVFWLTGTDSFFVLCAAQAVATGITVLGGFLITRELFENRKVELTYLVSLISFLPIYNYVLYIYGEAFGACFLVWAIYFFLRANRSGNERKRRILFFALSIFFMSLAYLARRGYLVAFVAFCIYQILLCMREKKILPLFGLLAMFLAMNLGQTVFLKIAEIKIGTEYDAACPTITWVAMGMMDSSEGSYAPPGSYNGYNDMVYEESGYNPEISAKIAGEYIGERILYFKENPKAAFYFYKEKLMAQWNEPTYGAFAMTYFMAVPADWVHTLYMGETESAFVRSYLNRYQSCMYVAFFVGFLLIFLKKCDLHQIFPMLLLLGGFFLSLIWETKSRYVYAYVLMALPSAAMAYQIAAEKSKAILFQVGLTVKRRFQK